MEDVTLVVTPFVALVVVVVVGGTSLHRLPGTTQTLTWLPAVSLVISQTCPVGHCVLEQSAAHDESAPSCAQIWPAVQSDGLMHGGHCADPVDMDPPVPVAVDAPEPPFPPVPTM